MAGGVGGEGKEKKACNITEISLLPSGIFKRLEMWACIQLSSLGQNSFGFCGRFYPNKDCRIRLVIVTAINI